MIVKHIKQEYDFTAWDEKVLSKLAPLMKEREKEFVESLYNRISRFEDKSKYLKNDAIIHKHKSALQNWFHRLFHGPYDRDYFNYLEKIGYMHVKVHLPSHYVNAALSHVRKFCADVIAREVPECGERGDMQIAMGKILDINIDILTTSYIEEEKNIFFISKQAEGKLINFAERFSYGLNLILVMGLVALGLTVLGLFAYDITHVFYGSFEKGLIAALGSLLMLWVVIELVDTEVDHLRGARFSINVFVSVAMVAIIRKILVTSLKSEAVEAQLSLIAALAVLGALHWIVSHTEKMK